jgi:hypothetical protein
MSEEPLALDADERRLAAILAVDVAGYSRLMACEARKPVTGHSSGPEANPFLGRATDAQPAKANFCRQRRRAGDGGAVQRNQVRGARHGDGHRQMVQCNERLRVHST